MLKIKIIALGCVIECLLNEGSVFRMNSLEYQVHRRLVSGLVIFKDSEGFF